MRFTVFACLVLLSALCPPSADAGPLLARVRVGFSSQPGKPQGDVTSYFKAGAWTPVVVRLDGGQDGFAGGKLLVETADTEDALNRYPLALPPLAQGQSRTVVAYANPGSLGADIKASVQSEGRKYTYAGEKDYEPLDFSKQLYLLAGPGAPDLEDVLLHLETDPNKQRVRMAAYADRVSRLPDRWFGYDAVDLMVLTTSDRSFVQQLLADRPRRTALAGWVRRGGRLIVSVSPDNSDLVANLLEAWRPAFPSLLLRQPVSLSQLNGMVQFAEAYGKPFGPSPGQTAVPLARLRPPGEARGLVETLAEEGKHPLLVQVPYGSGSVTLLALDLARGPFVQWDGRKEFWHRLITRLGPRLPPLEQSASENLAAAEENDVATDLQKELEVFADLRPVSFGWVALFIFLYILAVGPLDYLFLKKVVKRLHWTWVTFPVIVVVVTAAALWAASGTQGKEVEINKVDLLDIDMLGPHPHLQATTWWTLFSPTNQRYTVGIEPGAWANGGWEANRMVLVSSLGRPETGGLNSTGRRRAQGLYQSLYDYAPDAAGLSGIHLPFASTRTFTASWESAIPPPLTAVLTYTPDNTERLAGTLTSHLAAELQNPVLFFGGKWYTLEGPLVPGQKVALAAQGPRDFGDWQNTLAVKDPPHPRPFDTTRLLTDILFHDKLNQGGSRRNNALRRLDQSWRLRDLDHRAGGIQGAVLFGRLPRREGPAEEISRQTTMRSRLWLGSLPGQGSPRQPLPGTMIQDTYVRVFIPVKPGPRSRPAE